MLRPPRLKNSVVKLGWIVVTWCSVSQILCCSLQNPAEPALEAYISIQGTITALCNNYNLYGVNIGFEALHLLSDQRSTKKVYNFLKALIANSILIAGY